MNAPVTVPPESMTREERVHAAYAAGRLRFKFQPHQRLFYDAFHAWNNERQTRAYLDRMRDLGAQYDNMWVNRWSRRVGKTACTLLLAHEASTRFALAHGRGAEGMIAIPVQKKIGGVLVPLTKTLFADAPKGYAPEYRGSGQGKHEHLYIPAIEARIVLVGINEHPRALAGTYLDFFGGTEFGFTEPGMADEYTSIIQPQFQHRPWAWALIESSEPEVIDHDFNTVFTPDAQARKAYWSMVITDNTSLTPEQIEDEIRRTGGRLGREHPTCKRELFNIVAPDPETMVCPEFDGEIHVVDPADWPTPEHALAYVGMDPGTTDPFGLVGGYLDWMRQVFVFQFAWQKPNASTGEVAERTRALEAEFWGTEHATPNTREPNKPLHRIGNARYTGGGKVWDPPQQSLTYWDEATWTLRPNPFSRISDVHNRFILDMNRDYAMAVRAAEKEPGSAEEDLQYLRMLCAARNESGLPKIVILDNGHTEPLIQQFRSLRWKMRDDVHKVDWQRSKLLGHGDCFAAAKYLVRDIRWTRNPFPPEIRDLNSPDLHVPKAVRERASGAGTRIAPPRVLGGGGYKPRTGYSTRRFQ
jgi:hypothetical protein